MPVIALVALPAFLTPVAGAEVGEICVAFERMMHFGEVYDIGGGQGFAVDFAAANHADFFVQLVGPSQGTEHGGGRFAAGRGPAGLAGHHDVGALGEGAAQAVVGAAAHHHRVPQGEALEVLKVVGQVPPRQLTFVPNDPVFSNCDHK